MADDNTDRPASDVAFTDAVKAEQEHRGSRALFAQMDKKGGWATQITPDLQHYIGTVRSFYLATASGAGQPYVQHRGGPAGFLHVRDARTLAFADFAGNRQYITLGHLSENPRAFLFLMDYAKRRRFKLWGTAEVIENDADLLQTLTPDRYVARVERAIVFRLIAWDRNCPQHIPKMAHEEDVMAEFNELRARILELEAENARLRAQTDGRT